MFGNKVGRMREGWKAERGISFSVVAGAPFIDDDGVG